MGLYYYNPEGLSTNRQSSNVEEGKKIREIYCFPGNAGTSKIAKNIDINVNDLNKLKEFIISEKIELIVVGPEKPLVEGIVDFFENT